MSLLDAIAEGVRADLAERQQRVGLHELQAAAERAPKVRDGIAALRGNDVRVICEVKRSSPARDRSQRLPIRQPWRPTMRRAAAPSAS